jgi:disulfide bond formation protein DsbB
MVGSLYLSDVMHFLPCLLCWYQRIAMYPLVVVLGVGMLRSDPGVWRFAIPLPVIGAAIAAYHVMIQWRPNLEVTSCAIGAPCTGRYVAVFGFISIPTMAAAAFLLITVLLLLVRALEQEG